MVLTEILTGIAAGIRALRKEKLDWSQERLARYLDVSLGAVQKWEAGKSPPSGDRLIKMLQMCPDRESFEAFGIAIPSTIDTAPGQAYKGEGQVAEKAEPKRPLRADGRIKTRLK